LAPRLLRGFSFVGSRVPIQEMVFKSCPLRQKKCLAKRGAFSIRADAIHSFVIFGYTAVDFVDRH